jgi:hypothetical protein
MMDWSAVMYAGLVVGGAIVVVLMVLWTLSTESAPCPSPDHRSLCNLIRSI